MRPVMLPTGGNHTEPQFVNDFTGRLPRYDPRTKRVLSVLMKGLGAATGVSISPHRNFLLVSEYHMKRVHRFWLRGSAANTSQVFLNLPRNPYKIRRTSSGAFWVAMASRSPNPTPLVITPLAQKLDINGVVLAELDLDKQYHNKTMTGVVEHNEALYPTSGFVSILGVYTKSKSPKLAMRTATQAIATN
ncbi:protein STRICTOSIDINE SYNTHASE-LIKE 12-like [Diospyros lotus]|uniref:protein STRICTOSIDINE SYNTHASE-LIKE 12-like n=1 Tax=Diospyros lotus TaxID=55363 RepID=UPI0022505FD4|nr:protein STRICTOSIDINE SYNTHASE-LIKE 12-like [Diospyros lotus]